MADEPGPHVLEGDICGLCGDNAVVRTLLELLSKATGDAAVLILASRGDVVCAETVFDQRTPRVPAGCAWPTTDPLWRAAWQDGAVVLEQSAEWQSAIVACGPASVAIVGLVTPSPHRDGRAVVLLPGNLDVDQLEAAVPLVQRTAEAVADAARLRHDVDQARRDAAVSAAEAGTDPLTGLANRRTLRQHILEAEGIGIQRPKRAGVIVIDVDGLKAFNDRHGHPAGDALLVRAAGALRSATEDSNVLARVGGDEFVVLSVDADAQRLRQLEQRVRRILASHGIPASVGAALRRPRATIDDAWQEADRRMYRAKQLAAGDASRHVRHGYVAGGL